MHDEWEKKSDILNQKYHVVFDDFVLILFRNQKHSLAK
jgi:hypothetical protein